MVDEPHPQAGNPRCALSVLSHICS